MNLLLSRLDRANMNGGSRLAESEDWRAAHIEDLRADSVETGTRRCALLFDQDQIVGGWPVAERAPADTVPVRFSDSGYHQSESQKAALRAPLTELAAAASMPTLVVGGCNARYQVRSGLLQKLWGNRI
jgi:hypothetical protein